MAEFLRDQCDSCHAPIRLKPHAPIGSWCCRVWYYIRRPDDRTACWIWTGATNRNGYGFLSKPGKRSSNMLAHRAAYELVKGSIEPGLVLLHECDVPACCNPDHLRPGTQGDNIRDAYEKGRMVAPTGSPGEANPNALLTDDGVRMIRRLWAEGVKQGVIGQRMGVSRTVVNNVLRGRSWRHVQ